MISLDNWPKRPPLLTAEQEAAREQFLLLWHQKLPRDYAFIESFSHGFAAKLPLKPGARTLEIGAGIGGQLDFEDLRSQDYSALESREQFCSELRKRLPPERVFHGSIEERQHWPDRSFDRIVAIHMLEHLRNLPAAVEEVARLLKDDGVFDVVIPCEGSLAYSIARRISARRLFEKTFRTDYTPIIQNEHVNTYAEVVWLLRRHFAEERSAFFPLNVPVPAINVVAGMRWRKRAG